MYINIYTHIINVDEHINVQTSDIEEDQYHHSYADPLELTHEMFKYKSHINKDIYMYIRPILTSEMYLHNWNYISLEVTIMYSYYLFLIKNDK